MATPLVGPHTWRLRKAVSTAIVDVPAEKLVLVGLSGGPDSLALAAATAATCKHAGAVIVDHGLQAGSAKVAQAAADTAQELGLNPVQIVRVDVPESPDGLEAAARTARYAALTEAASQLDAAAVLLAHTRDDVAESVLLGLARGSGPAALARMRAHFGVFRRPLLELTRQDTAGSCRELGLAPWHDPQNSDTNMLRARIRTQVLPVLEDEIGPGIAGALARTAELLRQDTDALAEISRHEFARVANLSDSGCNLAVDQLAKLPVAVATRVIRMAAVEVAGSSLLFVHTQAVMQLVTNWHGQGELDLPGVVARRVGQTVVLTRRTPITARTASNEG